MKVAQKVLFGLVAILSICVAAFAADKTVVSKVVQDVYPGLSNGALSYASLAELPEGVLLKAQGVEVKADTIAAIIDFQPQAEQEEYKKNAFFILEQEATGKILLSLAKQAIAQSEAEAVLEDNALIQKYFETVVFKDLQVTDTEVKDFYEKNKELCGGAPLTQVESSLKVYVLGQKKQQVVSEYIRVLGKQNAIEVSSSWVKDKAVLAFDNPVDKARHSGKPSMVDFGASGCKACDMMTPILETLGKKYQDKVNVLFISVRQQQTLASRYGVQSIPVQVFFDKDGKEVFRHDGFFAQEKIENIFTEMGF